MSPNTVKSRVKPELDRLVKFCKKHGFKLYQVLGVMGRSYYGTTGETYDYKKSQIFDKIVKDIDPYETKTDVPVDKALAIQQQTEIGDRKYANTCRLLKDHCKLPQKNIIRKRKHVIVPKYEDTFNQGNLHVFFKIFIKARHKFDPMTITNSDFTIFFSHFKPSKTCF